MSAGAAVGGKTLRPLQQPGVSPCHLAECQGSLFVADGRYKSVFRTNSQIRHANRRQSWHSPKVAGGVCQWEGHNGQRGAEWDRGCSQLNEGHEYQR